MAYTNYLCIKHQTKCCQKEKVILNIMFQIVATGALCELEKCINNLKTGQNIKFVSGFRSAEELFSVYIRFLGGLFSDYIAIKTFVCYNISLFLFSTKCELISSKNYI